MNQQRQRPQLTESQVQGMMIGGFSERAAIDLPGGAVAECLDGRVWRILSADEELVGYINPTASPTGEAVIEEIRLALSKSEGVTYEL